jgi:hypothetical protein
LKGLLLRGLLVAALAAAVGVPASAAKSRAPRVGLAVLPLPRPALGPAARSLPLERAGSGVLVNGVGNEAGKLVVGSGLAVTPNASFPHAIYAGSYLQKLGRVSGYALDYGLGASGGTGVTEVRTSVDEWRTAAGAEKGLALWQAADRLVTKYGYMGDGLAISLEQQKVAHVGSRRFAYLVGYHAADIAPLFGLDEQFTRGRYEADVTVWAGTAAAAKQLAPRLAKKLDARIGRALAGKLHARPVKLPPKQKAGPPPGGPDLAQLALQSTDLSGKATPFIHSYVTGGLLSAFAVSDYYATLIPAGPFSALGQQIQWFASANQASFQADFDATFFGQGSPLDLTGLGDGARGELANGGSGDSTGYAELVFSSGRLEELLAFDSDSAIEAANVQSVARTVASKIDAAGLGS